MGPKIIPSHGTHGNPHPTLYKEDHWDHHFSLLPFCATLPLYNTKYLHLEESYIEL